VRLVSQRHPMNNDDDGTENNNRNRDHGNDVRVRKTEHRRCKTDKTHGTCLSLDRAPGFCRQVRTRRR